GVGILEPVGVEQALAMGRGHIILLMGRPKIGKILLVAGAPGECLGSVESDKHPALNRLVGQRAWHGSLPNSGAPRTPARPWGRLFGSRTLDRGRDAYIREATLGYTWWARGTGSTEGRDPPSPGTTRSPPALHDNRERLGALGHLGGRQRPS